MNRHSYERLYDRVISNGVPQSEVDQCIETLQRIASEAKTDIAVLFYRFATKQVSDLSNGDEVWAIIRENKIVTIMLRRNTQPKTVGALRVSKVVIL